MIQPFLIDNDPAINDGKNILENDEIKKPEGPSLQSRAETFVEFMKTVKEGILKWNSFIFYYYNIFP